MSQCAEGAELVGHSLPVAVTDVNGATALAAGSGHTCALIADGSVRCWSVFSQICEDDPKHLPHEVQGVENAVEITASTEHSCARTADGDVFCWGASEDGALGDGRYASHAEEATRVLGLPAPAIQLSAGNDFTCAVLSTRDVYCWGRNAFGQLGWGSNWVADRPIRVLGLPPTIARHER